MKKEEKSLIRKKIAVAKKTYTEAELDKASEILLQQLETHPRFKNAQTVLLYYSLPDEVRTHQFITKWSRNKNIILPVVKGNLLELRRYLSAQEMQKGSFGITEPIGEAWTNYDQIDLAIIPGVSFDQECNRLGRGKGYYDRLLPQLKAYKIGICFQFQISPLIPTETFDTPMDEVRTENELYIKQ